MSLGGLWNGTEPKSNIDHWINHPDIVGSVSYEPRRVSHKIWSKLASKGDCLSPPSQPLATQKCNDDEDCDDRNSCTIDVCDVLEVCAISATLENCCGNNICEEGEGRSCMDCGPFTIDPSISCDENCHSLDGFMIDIGVSKGAERSIFVSSISLAYSSPEREEGARIDVYVTGSGSYVGNENTKSQWDWIHAATVARYNPRKETGIVEILLDHAIPIDIGERRGLYFVASEEIIKFAEGVSTTRNKHGVELYSSRAVAGFFGDSIDGFALSCAVSYSLDDSPPPSVGPSTSTPSTSAPVESPSPTLPTSNSNMDAVEAALKINTLSPPPPIFLLTR